MPNQEPMTTSFTVKSGSSKKLSVSINNNREDEDGDKFYSIRESGDLKREENQYDLEHSGSDSGLYSTPRRLKSIKLQSKITGSIDGNDSNNNTKDDESLSKKNRKDVYGNKISKGGKKHKVVFADHKTINKPLNEIHFVESYKKYNTDMSSKGGNKSCCTIF